MYAKVMLKSKRADSRFFVEIRLIHARHVKRRTQVYRHRLIIALPNFPCTRYQRAIRGASLITDPFLHKCAAERSPPDDETRITGAGLYELQ